MNQCAGNGAFLLAEINYCLKAFPEGKVAFAKQMTDEGLTGNAERLS